MGLSHDEFLGAVSVNLNSIMILPIFSPQPLAGFQPWGKNFFASDYGKNPGSAAEGSCNIIFFPSKLTPELAEHLQQFRRN